MDKLPPCFLKGIILEGRWCESTCDGGYVHMWLVRLTSSSSLLYRAMSLRKVRTMIRAKIPEK